MGKRIIKKCVYCGADCRIWQKDHIIPKSRNGTVCVPCCTHCNKSKSIKTVQEYRLTLVRKRENIPRFTQPQIDFLLTVGFDFIQYLKDKPAYIFYDELTINKALDKAGKDVEYSRGTRPQKNG